MNSAPVLLVLLTVKPDAFAKVNCGVDTVKTGTDEESPEPPLTVITTPDCNSIEPVDDEILAPPVVLRLNE